MCTGYDSFFDLRELCALLCGFQIWGAPNFDPLTPPFPDPPSGRITNTFIGQVPIRVVRSIRAYSIVLAGEYSTDVSEGLQPVSSGCAQYLLWKTSMQIYELHKLGTFPL